MVGANQYDHEDELLPRASFLNIWVAKLVKKDGFDRYQTREAEIFPQLGWYRDYERPCILQGRFVFLSKKWEEEK